MARPDDLITCKVPYLKTSPRSRCRPWLTEMAVINNALKKKCYRPKYTQNINLLITDQKMKI